MLAAGTLAIEVGGQANSAETLGAMEPAPAPPVCQGSKVPEKGFPWTPRDAQIPCASRGSVGMNPFSRPSL